jgi:hypothetical protein
MLQFLLTSNVPRSLILATLMMEAIRFSETSALTKATMRHIRETAFLTVIAEKTSNLTWLYFAFLP